jgi:ubiquinone/menaquinone biosynthesis C-methylase UbiE
MKYTADFVIKVNEIYADVEGREYENRHPEIFIDESDRWCRIGKQFVAGSAEKITLLDIGSGTGFVPLKIADLLKENDTCICSDVSYGMLDVCKKNLSGKKFKCNFAYLKLDGKTINLESDSLTHITLNSVLHHVPDFSLFFKEVDRLLRIKGRLIIGHEPSKSFYTNKLLRINSKLCDILANPKLYAAYRLKKFGLIDASSRLFKDRYAAVMSNKRRLEEANRRFLKAGLVKEPLTADQLSEIVDFHSPTAGGFHKERGINISELLSNYLPNYEIEHFETYNHLGKVRPQNRLMKRYDWFLKKLFPRAGATFLVVLKKGSHL